MPFFYKNKNQTETQKKFQINTKLGGINVYTFIFLRKNIRINIYPLSENPLGGFPFSLFSDESRPNVCHFVIADVSPPQIRK